MSVEHPEQARTPSPQPSAIPRWVKVSGMVVATIVVLLVLAMLALGGDHGPGRHLGGDDASPSHTPPPGAHE